MSKPHLPPLSDLSSEVVGVLEAVLPSMPNYPPGLVQRMTVSSTYVLLQLPHSDPRAFKEALMAQRVAHDGLLDQVRRDHFKRLGPVSFSFLERDELRALMTADAGPSLDDYPADSRFVGAHVLTVHQSVQVECQRAGWRWPTTVEVDRFVGVAVNDAAEKILDLPSDDGHPSDPDGPTSETPPG